MRPESSPAFPSLDQWTATQARKGGEALPVVALGGTEPLCVVASGCQTQVSGGHWDENAVAMPAPVPGDPCPQGQ